jgi:hypothetical protein
MAQINESPLAKQKHLLEQVKLIAKVDNFADEWRGIHQQLSAEYECLAKASTGLSDAFQSISKPYYMRNLVEQWWYETDIAFDSLDQLSREHEAVEEEIANLMERRRTLITRLGALAEQMYQLELESSRGEDKR